MENKAWLRLNSLKSQYTLFNSDVYIINKIKKVRLKKLMDL